MQNADGLNVAEAEAAGASGPNPEPKPLPAQALDHATGYLMAFGAMTALKRRATEGGSWHVRCSLAQTGHWVRDLGRIEGGLACPDPSFDDVRDLTEDSDVRLRPADRRAQFRRDVGNADALGAAVGAARHPRAGMAALNVPACRSRIKLLPKLSPR